MDINGKRNGKSLIVVFCAIYIIILGEIYKYIISPPFSYMGYVYYKNDIYRIVFAYLIAVLPSIWLPNHIRRPSQVAYWLLYIILFVPCSIIPLYSLNGDSYNIVLTNLTFLAAFLLLGSIYRVPLLNIKRIQLNQFYFSIVLLFLSALFNALVVWSYGFNFKLAALLDVYELREQYVSSGNRFVFYALAWQGNVINPFLMASGLIYRKWPNLILGIFGQLFLFSVTGSKSILMSSLLIIALLAALKAKGQKFGVKMIIGAGTVIAIATAIDIFTKGVWFTSLIVRRLIVTPGLLTGYYIDFFSNNPKLFLSHSIFSAFVDYPYDIKYTYLIGAKYIGNISTSANANFLADGYANFGFFGIFVFTLLLGFILWTFDSLGKTSDLRLISLILGIPCISLSNSAILTSILTHGIGLALVLTYFLPYVKANKGVQMKKEHTKNLISA